MTRGPVRHLRPEMENGRPGYTTSSLNHRSGKTAVDASDKAIRDETPWYENDQAKSGSATTPQELTRHESSNKKGYESSGGNIFGDTPRYDGNHGPIDALESDILRYDSSAGQITTLEKSNADTSREDPRYDASRGVPEDSANVETSREAPRHVGSNSGQNAFDSETADMYLDTPRHNNSGHDIVLIEDKDVHIFRGSSRNESPGQFINVTAFATGDSIGGGIGWTSYNNTLVIITRTENTTDIVSGTLINADFATLREFTQGLRQERWRERRWRKQWRKQQREERKQERKERWKQTEG